MGQESNLPVKVGEEYDLEITEASKIGADGVAPSTRACDICEEWKIGTKGASKNKVARKHACRIGDYLI